MTSAAAMIRITTVFLLCGCATSGQALTINLRDAGGVGSGTAVEAGFAAAASFWEGMFANDVTININTIFTNANFNVSTIGSTTVKQYSVAASTVERQLAANATTALDESVVAHMPTLTNGALKVIMPGYNYPTTRAGVNTNYKIYDSDTTTNNTKINGTTANLKALGIITPDGPDGTISFNSNFAFDFNPDDGITPGTVDFIGVAIHEIGHVLGFTSGVDYLDNYGSKGPGKASWINVNTATVGTILDMFRYSNDPANLVAGSSGVLDWTPGTASYFSVDGGASVYGANADGVGGAYFSTGLWNGDGRQASHWKDSLNLGLLDPTLGYGQRGLVSALDLAAFDAIGWNPIVDAVNQSGYLELNSSAPEVAAITSVPEPASWAMLIAGFGLVGAATRRARRVAVAA